MNKKIIFHYPGPFYDILDAGEKKRPKRMYEAFCDLGYDVFLLNGTYLERKKKFSKIKNDLKSFKFIYSENSTLPLRLCNNSHLPLINSPDYIFFKLAHEKKIPIGVFYRDIFWRYSEYKKQIGLMKYLLALSFYKSELKLYVKYASNIFIPSERMKKLMPNCALLKTSLLPPAENLHSLKSVGCNNKDYKLNLIYVGSICPPKYDISNFTEKLKRLKNKSVSLTLITRKNEFEKYKQFYQFSDSVRFVIASGDELVPYYLKANIAVLYFAADEYMKMAMPQKLFEAVGFGLPILTYRNTAVADFVKKNDIGWVVSDDNVDILKYLLEHPEEIKAKRQNVLKIREEHTWKARAEQVIKILETNRH